MKIALPSLFFLMLLAPLPAAELDVIVTGIAHARGQVRVAVWTSRETFLKKPAHTVAVAINPKTLRATARLTGLPDQPFAVSAYHDENNNGVLDTNFLGIPKEPVGFANNAKGRMGPPAYEQATLVPTAQKGPLVINLGAVR